MFFRCRPSMSILRQSAPTLLQFGANFGRLCHQLVPTSAKVGAKLPQVGPKFAQVADFGVQNGHWEAQVADLEVQNGPWDQVKGCRDAPRMHRGCTRDAPRMPQGRICTSTWALGHTIFKEYNLEHITVDQSAFI